VARTSDPHSATLKAWETRGRARAGSGSDPTQIRGGNAYGGEEEFPETKDYAGFIKARSQHPLTAYTSPLSESDLKDRHVFMSKDGKTGYTIDQNGDLGNVFNLPGGEKGRGSRAVVDAIQRGAKTLDCFDGFLPQFYVDHGFVPVARLKFDPAQAPATWEKRFGTPDVVFMRYEGGPRRTLGARRGSFGKVRLEDAGYVSDYDSGQSAAR
jgi:hypothetical protein